MALLSSVHHLPPWLVSLSIYNNTQSSSPSFPQNPHLYLPPLCIIPSSPSRSFLRLTDLIPVWFSDLVSVWDCTILISSLSLCFFCGSDYLSSETVLCIYSNIKIVHLANLHEIWLFQTCWICFHPFSFWFRHYQD